MLGAMIKLYGFPQTRTNRVQWALEELGVAYEYVRVEVPRGAHKRPEHLALHPHGSVPVLVDGEQTILESCAAVLYLADRYPAHDLAPAAAERGAYYQWIVYAAATIDDPAIKTLFHARILPPERRQAAVVEAQRPTCETIVAHLERALAGKTWLLGDGFTAADVAVGYALNLLDVCGYVAGAEHTAAYLGRLRARPAFKAVYGG